MSGSELVVYLVGVGMYLLGGSYLVRHAEAVGRRRYPESPRPAWVAKNVRQAGWVMIAMATTGLVLAAMKLIRFGS